MSESINPILETPVGKMTGQAAFGSASWYAARWKSHWAALKQEIGEVEAAILDNLSKTTRSFSFDGKHDYIELSQPFQHDFSAGVTVEVWVRYKRFNSWSRIIDFGNGENQCNLIMTNEAYTNNLIFSNFGSDRDRSRMIAPNLLVLGRWLHLAATVDARGTGTIYCNGEAVIEKAGMRLPEPVERRHNYIGRSHWLENENFSGDMRELRIWNIARSQEEIQSNFVNFQLANDPHLVGYWPFDEEHGTVIYDQSIHQNHGLLPSLPRPAEPYWATLPMDQVPSIDQPDDNSNGNKIDGNEVDGKAGSETDGDKPVVGSPGFDEGGTVSAIYPNLDSVGTTSADTTSADILSEPGEAELVAVAYPDLDSTGETSALYEVIENDGESEGEDDNGPMNLLFDGTDDYVALSEEMNPDYSDGFTVEAWVYYNNLDKPSNVIDFGNGVGLYNIMLTNHKNDRSFRLQWYHENANFSEVQSEPHVLRSGCWLHLAATVDSDGHATLYCDGEVKGETEWARPIPSVPRKLNYVGRSHWRAQPYFDGSIADLRLWNQARTAEQIQHDMANPPGTDEPNLVGYWPLDEGSGLAVYDHSGSGYHGQLGGFLSMNRNAPTDQLSPYIYGKHGELFAIAKSLRDFATASFAFFHNGFYPSSQEDATVVSRGHQLNVAERVQKSVTAAEQLLLKLESFTKPLFYTSEKYATNFVLSSLIEQASHDLNLLQQIYYQRLSGGRQAITTFLIAEELGRRALAQATGTLLDARYQSVLAYLGNRMEVRLLPYHDSVIMGIPRVSHAAYEAQLHTSQAPYDEGHGRQQIVINYPMTFTAIPHEIGHVIYRFGLFPLSKGNLHIHRLLRNRLLAKPYNFAPDDWRFHWLEEIFADAYGCLIAGPISVLGFQLMLADGPPQHLRGHLGDHPVPVLRPLLQSQILRQTRTLYGNPVSREAPALLDARWQNWVADNWPQWVAEMWLGYTDQPDIIRGAIFEVAGEPMTGQEILDALAPVIEVVLLTLTPIRPKEQESTWTPTWQPAHDTEQLSGLYNAFVEFAEDAAAQAMKTVADPLLAYETSASQNQTLLSLLSQFEGEGAEGWRARSGGIDGLIELILFESWSDEGGRATHNQ